MAVYVSYKDLMPCPARSLMHSPTSTLNRGRAALCTWAATHNVPLFHTVLKVMPPMVRGCRLLIEAHGHYLHVLFAVNVVTNTFELFFRLSFVHLGPPMCGFHYRVAEDPALPPQLVAFCIMVHLYHWAALGTLGRPPQTPVMMVN